MGYYMAGGYYQAGGFFDSIGKVFKKVSKAVSPIFKSVVKPLAKVVVGTVPGLKTASDVLAHVDPTNPHGMVGSIAHQVKSVGSVTRTPLSTGASAAHQGGAASPGAPGFPSVQQVVAKFREAGWRPPR